MIPSTTLLVWTYFRISEGVVVHKTKQRNTIVLGIRGIQLV
jgi:hypothetical protein